MPETVLVTGAAGFVGRTVVPYLEAAGFMVVRYGRMQGDLSAGVPAAPAAACVVHLAGRTFVPESWEQPSLFYRDNTLATANVLEYARRTGARVVHLSSYAYGIPQRLPIPETHPLRAMNPYAHSKILAEDLVRFYQQHFDVAATILRPFNLYGPGQDVRFVVPSIVRQVIDPAVPEITVSDLRPRRDYLHLSDLASIIVAAIHATPGRTYNAGSGTSISVGDLVDLVRELAGSRKPVCTLSESRPNEIQDVVADISRAARELGWQPKMSLREGVRDALAWAAREVTSR